MINIASLWNSKDEGLWKKINGKLLEFNKARIFIIRKRI